MLRFFFKDKTNPAVRRLYDDAVRQARTPAFYRDLNVADTVDGRFELVVFHITPLIDRLRQGDGTLSADGQALFDTFVSDMEQNLRTMGVGDLTVPKKMKKLAEAFYGRFDVYRKAQDREAMAGAVARNVYGEPQRRGADVDALADYALALRARVATADPLQGVAFPDPQAFAPSAAATAGP